MLWKTYLVFWVLWTTSSSMSLEKPINKQLRTTAGVYKIRDWDKKVMMYRRGSFQCALSPPVGIIFDNTMTMVPHINSTCKSAFYHLRNIARIRKFISLKTTETLVHAFVNSKLDYCNSLAYGLPKYLLQKLQYVQNAAARLITGIRKHDHITPILMDLHWLPVNQRIQFKILLLTFKSLNGLAPVYIDEMIQRYVPNRKLRSSSAFLLKQNKWNLKSYGFRTFTVAAPFLWNSLPLEVKSSPSLNIFKSKLKTHLFKCAFNLN